MNFEPKHILVPVAIEPEDMVLAEHAVFTAIDLAVKFSSRMTILHLVPALKPGGAQSIDFSGSVYKSFLKLLKSRIKEGKERLKGLEETAQERGIEVETRVMESLDSTSKVILEAAQDMNADLLVVGSHGSHGLSRAFFGSVAEKIVRNALVPVLILHAPVQSEDDNG